MQNNDRIVETIKVKHKDGFMLINKSDFNPEIHEEYNETNQDLQKMNKDVVPESLPEAQEHEEKEEPVETKDEGYDFEDEFEGVDPEGIIVPKPKRKNKKKDAPDSKEL